MSVSKTFECQSCETEGKIVIRTEDVNLEDVAYCPVCGGSIFDEDDE
ncbi:hypothetical protein UFOVP84_160 [uncultured Caudovirales phage]|uniref:Uncharacterized protein n=1 Tax=uncultured Caudovirales phage TaxID=2100421 RepID=A0A6J5KY43_9CAUD|nr:hypothetical protein UFOVP84_160 [uncultured Caudovirales phage]